MWQLSLDPGLDSHHVKYFTRIRKNITHIYHIEILKQDGFYCRYRDFLFGSSYVRFFIWEQLRQNPGDLTD